MGFEPKDNSNHCMKASLALFFTRFFVLVEMVTRVFCCAFLVHAALAKCYLTGHVKVRLP